MRSARLHRHRGVDTQTHPFRGTHTHTRTRGPSVSSKEGGKNAPLLERLSREKKLRKTEEDEPSGDSDESASFPISPRTVNRWLFMRVNETNRNVALRLFFFLLLDNIAGEPRPSDAHISGPKLQRYWTLKNFRSKHNSECG